jgi:hypothetical protein
MEDVFMAGVPFLLDAVDNDEEAPIVRHELLVSIGDMVDDKELIKPFLTHPDPIVYQSAEVALSYVDNRLKSSSE